MSSLRRWKSAGLLTELRPAEAQQLLPRSANTQSAPSASVLQAYYAGNGDPVEALWRRQADRCLEISQRCAPEQVCHAIEHALPSVGTVTLRVTESALHVHAGGGVATISRVVRHARVRNRRIRQATGGPRDIVRAVNAILASREFNYRFIELHAARGRHMFVAVDTQQARLLQEWGATRHPDTSALGDFAGWRHALPARTG